MSKIHFQVSTLAISLTVDLISPFELARMMTIHCTPRGAKSAFDRSTYSKRFAQQFQKLCRFFLDDLQYFDPHASITSSTENLYALIPSGFNQTRIA